MVLHDTRPPPLDALFRPGNTFDAIMTWPAGSLAGRTFTATLDAVSLTVAIVSNVMTVSATAAQTTTAGLGAHAFQLTETTGGLSDDLIVGTWVGSDGPNTAGSTSTTVTVDGNTVTVTVLGVGATLASLTVTGAISGASVAATGAVTAASATVSGAVSAGSMSISGNATWRSLPFAMYERLTFLAKQADELTDEAPTYVKPTSALPYGGWDFAPNVNQSIMWPFAPPRIGLDGGADIFWATYNVAVVWFNRGTTGGNARWRCRIRNLAIAIDAVTDTPIVDVTTTTGAAGQYVINAFQVAVAVPIVPAFFGSEYSLVMTRMGAEGTDTLEETGCFGMCSFNQAS